jgi:hypothetical protein
MHTFHALEPDKMLQIVAAIAKKGHKGGRGPGQAIKLLMGAAEKIWKEDMPALVLPEVLQIVVRFFIAHI